MEKSLKNQKVLSSDIWREKLQSLGVPRQHTNIGLRNSSFINFVTVLFYAVLYCFVISF